MAGGHLRTVGPWDRGGMDSTVESFILTPGTLEGWMLVILTVDYWVIPLGLL